MGVWERWLLRYLQGLDGLLSRYSQGWGVLLSKLSNPLKESFAEVDDTECCFAFGARGIRRCDLQLQPKLKARADTVQLKQVVVNLGSSVRERGKQSSVRYVQYHRKGTKEDARCILSTEEEGSTTTSKSRL